jgi:outer membrane protein OmpA-like peptidoglycan-associated protein
MLMAQGLLPEGLSPDQVAAALPGVDIAGLEAERRGRPAEWSGALEGISIVLPRFEEAAITVAAETMVVEGTLKPGFSAEGVRAALLSVIGRKWSIRVSAEERRPLAELMVSKRSDEIMLSGVLPVALDPVDALDTAGDSAGGEGLTGGGAGDADAWRMALRAMFGLMQAFTSVTGTVSEGRIVLEGELGPGYVAEEARVWLSRRLPEGWDFELAATETRASEGDRRRDLATGAGQTYRNGFWLPDVAFPVSADRCATEIEVAMAGEKVEFVAGGTEIEETGRNLINRLASVAIRCLNSSSLKMEVSGHTDSVGNDAENRALSEQRAKAVVLALTRRGVRANALIAVGRGEDNPIASNDTPEGRAMNRRIAFRWFEGNE